MDDRKTRVVVYGAGGHARVIADLIAARTDARLVAVADDASTPGQRCGGLDVQPWESIARESFDAAIIGVGDNQARAEIAHRLEERAIPFFTAVHPSAIVAPGVVLGCGTVVMAGAVVQTGTRLGRHVIVNTGATIDHDGQVGDVVHIAPGCHLAGHTTVEDGAFLGIGSVAVPGRTIGADAIVGAGSVILEDVAPGSTVVGQPARPLDRTR